MAAYWACTVGYWSAENANLKTPALRQFYYLQNLHTHGCLRLLETSRKSAKIFRISELNDNFTADRTSRFHTFYEPTLLHTFPNRILSSHSIYMITCHPRINIFVCLLFKHTKQDDWIYKRKTKKVDMKKRMTCKKRKIYYANEWQI